MVWIIGRMIKMVEYGNYKLNQSKDGYMPCCPKCGTEFEDGEIGDVKNYPADGRISVFFTCNECKEESSFIYKMDIVRDQQKHLGESKKY